VQLLNPYHHIRGLTQSYYCGISKTPASLCSNHVVFYFRNDWSLALKYAILNSEPGTLNRAPAGFVQEPRIWPHLESMLCSGEKMSHDRDKAVNGVCSGREQEYRPYFYAIEQFGILKKFQNDLFQLTGLPFDFVDIGLRHSEQLQAYLGFTPFCALVKSTFLGRKACECDERKIVVKCVQKRKSVIRRCHLGLVDICVPVVMNNKVAGLFCTGQFFYNQLTQKHFQRIQKRLAGMGVDVTKARQAYFSTPVIEKRRVSAIMDLIQMVVELIDAGRLPTLKTAVMHDPMRKALDFMEANYTEPITLPIVAREAGLSISRLAHVFKAQVKMSFTAYLNLIRVNWAKYYLTNSHLRVSETAFQVGFGNLSHFNHIFRRSTSLSPTQYRRQHTSTRI